MSGQSVYGVLKREMYRETIAFLEQTTEESIRENQKGFQWAREKREKEENVRRWEEEAMVGRAKL